jgi:hypothetical protein
MVNTFFRSIALLGLCLVIYFLVHQHLEKPGIISMSPLTLLTSEELRDLPGEAMRGDCRASTRLGDFYMTQLADPDEAEKWYRLAEKCSKDPRVKEFLIRCIVLNDKTDSSLEDVRRLFHEIEVMDSVRATRMRESVDKYILNATSKKSH